MGCTRIPLAQIQVLKELSAISLRNLVEHKSAKGHKGKEMQNGMGRRLA